MDGTHCWKCGKALDEPHTCSTCRGKGEIDTFVFLKKKCPTCRGSGVLMRCPDQKNHDLESERKILEIYKARNDPSNLKQPDKSVCDMCDGTGWIRGNPSPTTPNHWVKRPCPRCR